MTQYNKETDHFVIHEVCSSFEAPKTNKSFLQCLYQWETDSRASDNQLELCFGVILKSSDTTESDNRK